MKKLILIIAMAALGVGAFAQSFSVYGTVCDKASGETLIGCTVLDIASMKGTTTNAFGQYSLPVKGDTVVLRFSYIGYQPQEVAVARTQSGATNIMLAPSVELKEVVVTAERTNSPQAVQMSAIEVPVEHLKAVPVIFGETDVLKVLQLLPGVQSGTEGMSGMYVRGGGPDENLFLLDGVPMYNVNHLGGFFSAFNSDAVKNVTLYKGSFPAHFGGRLSSVLDITTNNGNDKELHGTASIGLISGKVSLEGPIVKEKTTFSISARRTYGDALIQPILGMSSLMTDISTRAGYYFYDLNTKITHKFSDKSRLFASYYMGDDVIYLKVKTRESIFTDNSYHEYMKLGYNWGNIVGSLRWNYIINPKLFMNVTGSVTRYRNDISLGIEEYYTGYNSYNEEQVDMTYKSGIHDYSASVDFDYAPNTEHNMKFGGSTIFHTFTPEVMGAHVYENYGGNNENSIDTTLGQSRVFAEEMNLFVEDDWAINDAVKVNYGVNLSGFNVEQKFYPSIQPRVSGRLMLSENVSLKAGYSYMTQYMHLLSNSSISLPTDLWVPVTARIAPMNSHQAAAGVFYNFRDLVDFSVEGYYKKMHNLLEYKDGASFWGSSVGWEDKVCMGDGWAYGVEFLAQKTIGEFTGWVGYTWSRTMRQFDREGQMINEGNPFPAKYDRRHDVSVVVMYKPNKRFDAALTWVLSSGNTATLAMQEFDNTFIGEEDDYYYYWTNETPYIESRNNFRMPTYHRMDASVNFHKELKHGVRTVNISVYNLYNRQNPFIVYEKEGTPCVIDGMHYGSSLVQLSLFPIIPSISYNYKF